MMLAVKFDPLTENDCTLEVVLTAVVNVAELGETLIIGGHVVVVTVYLPELCPLVT